jgi:mannose-6-phosphate isomerase-like protein (cupin superfamily)
LTDRLDASYLDLKIVEVKQEGADMATTYRLTPTEQVTILERDDRALVAEVGYGPAGSPPPAHVHPAQDEHFEVLEGEVTIDLAGDRRTLRAGETIDVPRRTAHQMWNAHPTAAARVRWTTTPALRTEAWWAALDQMEGKPTITSFAPLLREYRDVFRLKAPPQWIAQPLFAALSVGRRPTPVPARPGRA